MGKIPLNKRNQTIASAVIVTTDGHRILGVMSTDESVDNRLKGECHVLGTGVSHVPDDQIPSALRQYLLQATNLKVRIGEPITVGLREVAKNGSTRFVRHIHYLAFVRLTAEGARKRIQPGLDISEVLVVNRQKAKTLLHGTRVAFERTPPEVHRKL